MYVYANWSAGTQASCASLSFSQSQVPASVPQETEASWSHPNFRPSTLNAREPLGGTYPGLLLATNRDVDPAIFEFLAGEFVVTSVVHRLS